MNTNDKLICYLNKLTQQLISQKHVYSSYSKSMDDPILRLFLSTKTKDNRINIQELNRIIHGFGGKPVYKSSFVRMLIRQWAEAKILVMSNDHLQLLVQLHDEEEALLKAYQDFDWRELPKDLRYVLIRQMSDIRRNISQILRMQTHLNILAI